MKALAKAGLVGKVFLRGAVQGASSATMQSVALTAGLYQGMKYKGSFKTGATTTAVVYGSLVAACGLADVIKNAKQIKDADGYMVDNDGIISTYQVK